MAGKKKQKKLKVTPVSQWRAEYDAGEEVPLLSGRVVRLRPMRLTTLIRTGGIPNLLIEVANKALFQEAEEIAKDLESSGKFFELVDQITTAALIYPRIVDSPTADDEVTLDYFDDSDKLTIFRLATAGVGAMRSFRFQQTADVGSVYNMLDLESEAEPGSED